MKDRILTVLSNNPPGGRCTLYIRYAEELSRSLGLKMQTIFPGESHNHAAPGLLIGEAPVMPSDGIIIDPDDICNAIKQAGMKISDLAELNNRLNLLVDETIGGM